MANYANPSACYAIAILLPLLSAGVVAWRFWLRHTKKAAISVDDWLCIPALVFTIGCGIVVIVGTSKGAVGYHSSLSSEKNAKTKHEFLQQQIIIHQCSYAFNILAYIALGFIKLSFLFFYRRIFRGKMFNVTTWILVVISALWMLLFSLVLMFMCGIHFNDIQGPTSQFEAHCIDVFNENMAGSITDVILDIAILTIPIIMVLQLQMPVRHKLAVCAIFFTASISIAAAICRLVINVGMLAMTKTPSTVLGVSTTDEIGMGSIQLFWSMIEVGIAMVVVCMPTLHLGPVIHRSTICLNKVLRKHFIVPPCPREISAPQPASDRLLPAEHEHIGDLSTEKLLAFSNPDVVAPAPTHCSATPSVKEPYEIDGKPKSIKELDGTPKHFRELEGDKPGAAREMPVPAPNTCNWPLPAAVHNGNAVVVPLRVSSAPGPPKVQGKAKSDQSTQKSIKELEGDAPPVASSDMARRHWLDVAVRKGSLGAIVGRRSEDGSKRKSVKSLKELEGDMPGPSTQGYVEMVVEQARLKAARKPDDAV